MTAETRGIVMTGVGRPSRWQRRLTALLEVVGVFVVATLLARLASRALGPTNLRALAPGVNAAAAGRPAS